MVQIEFLHKVCCSWTSQTLTDRVLKIFLRRNEALLQRFDRNDTSKVDGVLLKRSTLAPTNDECNNMATRGWKGELPAATDHEILPSDFSALSVNTVVLLKRPVERTWSSDSVNTVLTGLMFNSLNSLLKYLNQKKDDNYVRKKTFIRLCTHVKVCY